MREAPYSAGIALSLARNAERFGVTKIVQRLTAAFCTVAKIAEKATKSPVKRIDAAPYFEDGTTSLTLSPSSLWERNLRVPGMQKMGFRT